MASGREGGCMDWSGRGAGGMSASGVGSISTSAGSSLGQILTGSSLGHTSFEGGQLGGCTDESEPIGDHIIRGEGLVPKIGKGEESSAIVADCNQTLFLCFAFFKAVLLGH